MRAFPPASFYILHFCILDTTMRTITCNWTRWLNAFQLSLVNMTDQFLAGSPPAAVTVATICFHTWLRLQRHKTIMQHKPADTFGLQRSRWWEKHETLRETHDTKKGGCSLYNPSLNVVMQPECIVARVCASLRGFCSEQHNRISGLWANQVTNAHVGN